MIKFRSANIDDIHTYFRWLNDPYVRDFSFNSDIIDFKTHKIWFEAKLLDKNCEMIIFQDNLERNIGQVRIQKQNFSQEAIIGVSVDSEMRGLGYSTQMLSIASSFFFKSNPNFFLSAYIKNINFVSIRIFKNAGFELNKILNISGFDSSNYIKYANRKL